MFGFFVELCAPLRWLLNITLGHLQLGATHHGSEGTVQSGANVIGEVNNFSITERAVYAEDTTLADVAKTTHPTAITDWDGQLTCWWDESDTLGQETIRPGQSVTITVAPEGNTTGDIEFSGLCRITEKSISSPKGGIVEATFAFEGTDILTQAAAA